MCARLGREAARSEAKHVAGISNLLIIACRGWLIDLTTTKISAWSRGYVRSCAVAGTNHAGWRQLHATNKLTSARLAAVQVVSCFSAVVVVAGKARPNLTAPVMNDLDTDGAWTRVKQNSLKHGECVWLWKRIFFRCSEPILFTQIN
jgi:hypothetical protein